MNLRLAWILALAPPADTMDQFRVRIDPTRSADTDTVVAMSITDRAARHAWHLRRGVVEFVADAGKCRRTPELELATDYDNWLRFFSCKRPLAEFLAGAQITKGSVVQVEQFFGAFDDYAGDANYVIPPVS